MTLPAEYVGYASEFGTQVARVTAATIAEQMNTFLIIISILSSSSADGSRPCSLSFASMATSRSKNSQMHLATGVPGA